MILLQRLSKLGVHGTEIAWFTSYIYQTVFSVSDIMVHIQSGAQLVGEYPRAAHLDHCLVYMNDLPSQVHKWQVTTVR